MARLPKPKAKASLSIYSTRNDGPVKANPHSELETDESPSRFSSSQSTTNGSPSDETTYRRASTSSSLSSYESVNNASFITLKYSPQAKNGTVLLKQISGSTNNSPSRIKSAEPSTDDVNESRTRSARNRKLTGKALDLAVTGKLYKAEKLSKGRNAMNVEAKITESPRSSPAGSLQGIDELKDTKRMSISEPRALIEQSRSVDAARSRTPIFEPNGLESLRDTASPDSIVQITDTEAKHASVSTLSRKRKRPQDDASATDPPARNNVHVLGIDQYEDASNSKHQKEISTPFTSKREPRKSNKGRDSMVGQASLRSTRQRVELQQADQIKTLRSKEKSSLLEAGDSSGLSTAQACDLDCLDEADVFLAFAEYIANAEEDDVEEEATDEQYSKDLERMFSVTESLPKLKEYCRCGNREMPDSIASGPGTMNRAPIPT